MKLVNSGIIFFLLITVLLFGCTEMTRQERNACYSLASKSYTAVPFCSTEQSCYEKVKPMFKTNLGYEQESQLYSLKNSLARSWFFYNKGVAEMKKISKLCSSGNVSALPGAINEARNNFFEAFRLNDEALKQSIRIVSNEEQILTSEDINLVKEEALYTSLIELRQILTELNSGSKNSGSYAAYYIDKTNAFNNLAASKGFGYIIEKESFWTEEYAFLDNGLIEWSQTFKDIPFASISKGLTKLFSIAENKIFSGVSLRELQKLPTAEMMLLYSNLAGNNNSAIKRFSDLMNKTSNNYSEVVKEKEALFLDNERLKKEINLKITEFNILTSYRVILTKMLSTDVKQEYDLEKNLKQNLTEFNEIKLLTAQNKLTLGYSVFRLKEINSDLKTINESITFNISENSGKMIVFCEDFAKNSQGSSVAAKELSTLSNNVLFYSSKTLSSDVDKLQYCTKLILAKEELNQAEENYALFESKIIDATSDCFTYLEKVFSEVSLKELENEFNKLKATPVLENNTSYFDESCKIIKSQVDIELSDKFSISELHKHYKLVEGKLLLLEEVSNTIGDRQYEPLSKQFDGIKLFFNTKDVLFFAHSNSDINKNLTELEFKIDNLTKEVIVIYALQNQTILIKTEGIPEINKEYSYSAKIILRNPYLKINKYFNQIFSLESNQIISKEECVSTITVGKNTSINYSCLELGNTEVNILGKTILLASESDNVLYSTNEKSLISRQIKINSLGENSKILFTTNALSNSFLITVNQKEVTGIITDSKLSFYAENIDTTSDILILFYINDLFDTECITQSNNNFTLNLEKVILECDIKNKSNYSLQPTLFLPFESNSYLKGVKVFDETHIAIDSKKEYKNITITKLDFLPKQTRTIIVELDLDNSYLYYSEQIENILSELSSTNNSDLIEEGNLILLSDPSPAFITTAQEFISKATKILKENNKLLEIQKNDALLILALENKVIEGKEYSLKLQELGLTNAQEKLDTLISQAEDALSSADLTSIKQALTLFSKLKFDISIDTVNEINFILKYMRERKGDNTQLKNIYLKATETKVEFDRFIEIDPVKSNTALVLLISLKKEFDLVLDELKDTDLINELNNLADTCKNLLNILRAELTVDESKLVASKFIKPITISRLDSLEVTIAKVINSDESISDKRDSLLQIKAELQSAFDLIKKQTFNAYNNSIDNKESSEVLAPAKRFIDNNKFISAFLILAGSNTPQNVMNFPFIYFIPIIIILVIGYFARQKFLTNKTKETAQKDNILESWKD